MGHFNLDSAIDKHGCRISALTAYLSKTVTSQRRDHLTICTGAMAARLEVDAQTGIVTGVHIRNSKGSSNEFFVKARREVIVCSGAACTPQLLLLSGIGPADSSEKFGISLVKELPAVGATLSDHYSVPITLEIPRRETFYLLETIWGIWHILLWLLFGKGLFSLTSVSTSLFVRSGAIDKNTMQVKHHDEEGHDNLNASLSRNVPDIEIMAMPTNTVERAIKGLTVMSLYPTFLQPRGSGRVELVSSDPLVQPRIIYPMLSNEHDIASVRLAVRFTMRLADEFQHSGYPYPAKFAFAPGLNLSMLEEYEKAAPAEYLPVPVPVAPLGSDAQKPQVVLEVKQDAAVRPRSRENKTWRDVTDDEIDDYSRRVCQTSLHFASTCPMSNDEKSGVVDQQLRVHGFSNLRIADTSVFPKIPSCHTMAPVMMVAERCADLVKATWKGKKSQ